MEKIKYFIESQKGKDIMTIIIIILVGISSFYLGRLSKKAQNEGIQIEYTNQQANVLSSQINDISTQNNIQNQNNSNTINSPLASTSKTYFASNRGQKYYSIHCSAGKTIKQENRIYFATKADAEKAGYELSASCK